MKLTEGVDGRQAPSETTRRCEEVGMSGDARLPPRWFIKTFWHVHRRIVRASRGRRGRRVPDGSSSRAAIPQWGVISEFGLNNEWTVVLTKPPVITSLPCVCRLGRISQWPLEEFANDGA